VISQAYEETVADRARRSERERTLLLDALLEGRTQDPLLVGQASRLLDLPERGSMVIVVAETPSPGLEGVPGLEQALRARGLPSAWRLRSHRQVGIVALAGSARSDDLRADMRARVVGRAGVSPMFTQLVDAHRFVTLADLALRCLPPGEQGVALYDDHPIGTLLVGAPDLAARLVDRTLGPLLALADDERDSLLHTLAVWTAEGGSASRAAERMYCHRNTVRNRLQRVESLIGRCLSDPWALTELCLAIEANRLATARGAP
jgi:sugar diacid utilization regulator